MDASGEEKYLFYVLELERELFCIK